MTVDPGERELLAQSREEASDLPNRGRSYRWRFEAVLRMFLCFFRVDDLTMPVPDAERALRVAGNRYIGEQSRADHHRDWTIGNSKRFGDSGVGVRLAPRCAV